MTKLIRSKDWKAAKPNVSQRLRIAKSKRVRVVSPAKAGLSRQQSRGR